MKAIQDSNIHGVFYLPLQTFKDERGSLTELFRVDALSSIPVANLNPLMGYYSVTESGVARGPHEHETQTDLFVFMHGKFELHLWDKKGNKTTIVVGESYPCVVVVPPGVVHGYRNIGTKPAVSMNFPNTLYKGWGKCQAIDEIRHENKAVSPYKIVSEQGE